MVNGAEFGYSVALGLINTLSDELEPWLLESSTLPAL